MNHHSITSSTSEDIRSTHGSPTVERRIEATNTGHKTSAKVPKLTREEEAKQVLEHTQMAPSVAKWLCACFLLTIFSVPLIQFVAKTRDREPVLPNFERTGQTLSADDLKGFESRLESGSVVSQAVLPQMQNVLTHLGVGNENAYVGRDGWLVYRPDLHYVTGRGFLEADQLKRRALAHESAEPGDEPIQPDPVEAIARFKAQLDKRHIRLILVPTPLKPMLEPQHFASGYNSLSEPLQNPSYREFLRRLKSKQIMVCDPTRTLFRQRQQGGEAQYLRTDTHWTPGAMQTTAQLLADFITKTSPLPPQTTAYTARALSISGQGDIANMLKLPAAQTMYPPQRVEVEQVVAPSGKLWRPSPSADVLLLGDSFTNIYSREGMGWGEAGGLAEQLSLRLQRRLDVISLNAGGSTGARQRLREELLGNPDRLQNTRIVVWQFAMRDLASGNWAQIDLPAPIESPGAGSLKWRPSSKTIVARFQKALARKAARVEKAKSHVADGSRGWLFYLSDLYYLADSGFLKKKTNPQIEALVDFKGQLEKRGISLIVMPAPNKAAIYSERLGLEDVELPQSPQNPSFAAYRKALRAQGIELFDPTGTLLYQKQRAALPLYMPTDTHWTFAGMDYTASALASRLKSRLSRVPIVSYKRHAIEVSNITDISLMAAREPNTSMPLRVQQTIQQVQSPGGEAWKPRNDSEVLVLGDSFTNIYTNGGRWGEGAGLAAQLSFYLQRPVDSIAINSGGVNETRLALKRDLERGNDRLAGKKVVIYEFASRCLLLQDWKKIELPLVTSEAKPRASVGETLIPKAGALVEATIKARSKVPDVANTPYPDLVMALRLSDIKIVGQDAPTNHQIPDLQVYIWALQEARPTKAASWKVGQRVTLRLMPWAAMEEKYGSYSRTELEGDAGARLETYWGEIPR